VLCGILRGCLLCDTTCTLLRPIGIYALVTMYCVNHSLLGLMDSKQNTRTIYTSLGLCCVAWYFFPTQLKFILSILTLVGCHGHHSLMSLLCFAVAIHSSLSCCAVSFSTQLKFILSIIQLRVVWYSARLPAVWHDMYFIKAYWNLCIGNNVLC
jgi:hypothetical protein